jgi:CMP-N-acetylneuraminic acid synthetase
MMFETPSDEAWDIDEELDLQVVGGFLALRQAGRHPKA